MINNCLKQVWGPCGGYFLTSVVCSWYPALRSWLYAENSQTTAKMVNTNPTGESTSSKTVPVVAEIDAIVNSVPAFVKFLPAL